MLEEATAHEIIDTVGVTSESLGLVPMVCQVTHSVSSSSGHSDLPSEVLQIPFELMYITSVVCVHSPSEHVSLHLFVIYDEISRQIVICKGDCKFVAYPCKYFAGICHRQWGHSFDSPWEIPSRNRENIVPLTAGSYRVQKRITFTTYSLEFWRILEALRLSMRMIQLYLCLSRSTIDCNVPLLKPVPPPP